MVVGADGRPPLLEQPDDFPLCIGSGFGVPDLARWLCCFESILLDPVRGGIIAREQFGKMTLFPGDDDTCSFPTFKLFRFDVAFSLCLATDRYTGLNRTIFRFVDGT